MLQATKTPFISSARRALHPFSQVSGGSQAGCWLQSCKGCRFWHENDMNTVPMAVIAFVYGMLSHAVRAMSTVTPSALTTDKPRQYHVSAAVEQGVHCCENHWCFVGVAVLCV
jgi:hypothetical protein